MKIWFGGALCIWKSMIFFLLFFFTHFTGTWQISAEIFQSTDWIKLRDKCVIEFQKFQIFGMHSHQFVFRFYFLFHYFFWNRRLESIIWFPLFLYMYLYTYCILSNEKGNGSGFFIPFIFLFLPCISTTVIWLKSQIDDPIDLHINRIHPINNICM